MIKDIIVNLVSDKIYALLDKKCENKYEKGQISMLTNILASWADQFEKDNPSTIISTDRFYNYCKNSHAINSILSRAIDTIRPDLDDQEYISYLTSTAVKGLKATRNDAFTSCEIDPKIINLFFFGLLKITNDFLDSNISLRDKIILGVLLNKFRNLINSKFTDKKNTINELTDKINSALRMEIQSCPSFLSETHFDYIKEKVLNQSEGSPEGPQINTLAASLLNAWQKNRHTVTLYGDGGMGKTVSLLSVHRVLQSQLIIYVPLRKVRCTADAPIKQYIEEAYLSDNPDLYRLLIDLCETDINNNEDRGNAPGLLLLLDGLNEASYKDNIIGEIENSWVKKKAVQTVISARYDASSEIENNNKPITHLKILEVDDADVDKYLTNRGIPYVNDPKVRELLKIPLILNLYANNETASKRKSPVEFTPRENICAGAIIWNYLQYTVHKSIVQGPQLYIKLFAANILTPYIAYQMFRQNTLYLSADQIEEYIADALKCRTKDFPSIVRNEKKGCSDNTLRSMNYFIILTKDLYFFHETGEGRFELYHQNFRDCLAAIYIYYYNTVLDDSFPNVWNSVFGTNVEAFLSDMIQTEVTKNNEIPKWDMIWQQIKHNPAHKSCHISNMIHLHKTALGNDFSDVDFGSLDLTDVSLAGCNFAGSKGHFIDAKLDFGIPADIGHYMTVTSVSWSQDDAMILATSYDRFMRVYNVNTCQSITPLQKHTLYIRSAQWNPKENSFASAGDDKEVLLWRNLNGQYKSDTMGTCNDWIMKLAWSSDGNCIVCGDNSGNIRLIEHNKSSFDFDKIHDKPIRQIIWSPLDSHKFATLGTDNKICIWHDQNQSPQYILDYSKIGEIISVYWMKTQGDMLVCSSNRAHIYHLEEFDPCRIEYDITEMEPKLEFNYYYKDVKYITVSSENDISHIALFSDDYAEIIHIKTDETGKYSLNVFASQKNDFSTYGRISCVQWNNKCNQIACGLNDGSVYLLDILESESTLNRIIYHKILTSYNNTARCSSWSHNGEYLAVGYSDCRIRVWNWQQKRCLRVFDGHADSVKSLAWSPDDKFIVSGSNDGTVKVWPWELTTSDNRFIDQHAVHKGAVNCVVWTGDTIISGSDDKKLVFWNHKKHRKPKRCNHDDRIYALSISDDGKYLVSGGNDKKICLWNISEIHYLDSRIYKDIGPIRGLAWGLGYTKIFFSSNDGHIYSLDPHPTYKENQLKGKKQVLPVEHESFVYSIARIGDRYLISASTDGYISILSLQSKKTRNFVLAHHNFIWNVSVSPVINDKYYAATSSSDGSVRIWDVTEPEKDIPHIATLQVIPDINISNCDFSGAIIDDKQLELVKMNGGIVEA